MHAAKDLALADALVGAQGARAAAGGATGAASEHYPGRMYQIVQIF